jgi:hypothetical protein
MVSDEELAKRKAEWKAPPLKATKGTLFKYIKSVRAPPPPSLRPAERTLSPSFD